MAKKNKDLFAWFEEFAQKREAIKDKIQHFTFHGKDNEYYVNDKGVWVFDTFDVSFMDFENFEGLPEKMEVEDFWCNRSNIKSLKGLPKKLKVKSFHCDDNQLTSFEGLPEGFVCTGEFSCAFNQLTTFAGIPDSARFRGAFYCQKNKFQKDFEGVPANFKVAGNIWCQESGITSLTGLPAYYDEPKNAARIRLS